MQVDISSIRLSSVITHPCNVGLGISWIVRKDWRQTWTWLACCFDRCVAPKHLCEILTIYSIYSIVSFRWLETLIILLISTIVYSACFCIKLSGFTFSRSSFTCFVLALLTEIELTAKDQANSEGQQKKVQI